jgi:SAM-dependent methyltransferase
VLAFPDEDLMHKGWFRIDGVQDGDRTLAQQLLGLETIADEFAGATVLDIGCAEGLIGRHCVDAWGASLVHGVTLPLYELEEARRQCAGRPMTFFQADLRSGVECLDLAAGLLPSYDVLLLLSVLHKVRDPMRLLEWAVQFAGHLVAIRLPAPVIDMDRCRPGVHPVGPWMAERFDVVAEPVTCIEPVTGRPEWMGIYRGRG